MEVSEMKKARLITATLFVTALMSFSAYAGQWQQDSTGWWYQNDDGSYPVNQWQEIDGKQYYFGADGYMLSNTTTPDGYQVGADGAWVVDGVVQTISSSQNNAQTTQHSVSNISYTADSVTNALSINDWIYDSGFGSTYHIFEITNNSPYTLNISINETAKDSGGSAIGANSTSQEDIPSGQTVFIISYFSNVDNAKSFDTSIQTKQEEYYIPVIQNVTLETTDLGDKVLIKATNNGGDVAEFVEAKAVFFLNNQVVDYGSVYLVDSDYELKPGATLSEQIDYYNFDGVPYDSVVVHLTGRKSIW